MNFNAAVLCALLLLPVNTASAFRPGCGWDMKSSDLNRVILTYETAYKAAGFIIAKKEISAAKASLWVLYEVKGSEYEAGVQSEFWMPDASTVSYCATITTVKTPVDVDIAKRNSYMGKFELAYRRAIADIMKPRTGLHIKGR